MRTNIGAAGGVLLGVWMWMIGGAFAQPPAAQPPPAAEPPAPTAQPAGKPAEPKDAPPSLKLGLRTALVRARLPLNPFVVVVPDTRSYLAAIDRWNFDGGVRFPVLIDDGSWPARQAIARFVRAYKPRSVLRWRAPDDSPAWPEDLPARHALLERLAAEPWLPKDLVVKPDQSIAQLLKDHWKQLQFTPPGIVVTSTEDPAWTGALALAAARGQPLAWLTAPGDPSAYMTVDDAAALERRVELFAEATGYPWSGLGDDIEAVTLALNCATKVFLGEKDQRGMLSLTDWIGRKPGETPGKPKDRWAWAGQLIGSPWQSACAAMSSIFLTTDTAWLFDGYDSSPPWNLFDATEAATVLEKAGIKTTLDDENNRSIAAWRRRAARGVSAGLVLINSSGNPDFFELKPGQGRPADVPVLARPAIVHMVHSWSAAAPADVNTVAGRWLERGAYAYVGSVHEPYLQAFVPTPKLAVRLTAGLPLGAAARLDAGEVWKLSVLGDPLTMLGKVGPVVETRPALDGAIDLAEDLARAVKDRDYPQALTDLLLLGRDDDAAQLLGAVIRQDQDKLTPDTALGGLASAFFTGATDTLVRAYQVAQPKLASEQAVRDGGLWDARDMLWHALAPTLGTLTRDQAQLLSLNMRAQTLVRDASDAYSAVSTAVNKEAARDVVARAARAAAGESERKQIEQLAR